MQLQHSDNNILSAPFVRLVNTISGLFTQTLKFSIKNIRQFFKPEITPKVVVDLYPTILRTAVLTRQWELVQDLLSIPKANKYAHMYDNFVLKAACLHGKWNIVEKLLTFEAVQKNAAVMNNLALKKAIIAGNWNLIKNLITLPVIINDPSFMSLQEGCFRFESFNNTEHLRLNSQLQQQTGTPFVYNPNLKTNTLINEFATAYFQQFQIISDEASACAISDKRFFITLLKTALLAIIVHHTRNRTIEIMTNKLKFISDPDFFDLHLMQEQHNTAKAVMLIKQKLATYFAADISIAMPIIKSGLGNECYEKNKFNLC